MDPSLPPEAPVHDVSVVLDSTIAVDAHRYLDVLWDYTCETTGVDPRPIGQFTPGGSRIVQVRMLLRLPTTIKVFQFSHLDALGVWEKTPADDAIDAILDSAQSSLKLASGSWSDSSWRNYTERLADGTLESLVDAVLRGVQVDVVLSSPNSIPGGLNGASANYGNGWTLEETKTVVLNG